MKEKLFEQKGNKYLIGFVVVMLLNLGLASFLIHRSFGQTKDYSDQKPLTVEVAEQSDSPLRITLINVDNSNQFFQTINYTVQNIGNEAVRGYVIACNGKETGKTVTSFFPTKLYQAGQNHLEELQIERENIKSNEILTLSVDYIKFDNGGSWGKDAQGQSEHISGELAGMEAAVKQLEQLINSKNVSGLTTLLEKQIADIEIPLTKTVQSEKWQKGFGNGYKSVVYFLKQDRGGSLEKLSKRLEEVRKNLKQEGDNK